MGAVLVKDAQGNPLGPLGKIALIYFVREKRRRRRRREREGEGTEAFAFAAPCCF